MINFLSCPQCGCYHTDGELCNLTCRRAWLTKINLMWRERCEKPLTLITAQDLSAEYEEFQRWRREAFMAADAAFEVVQAARVEEFQAPITLTPERDEHATRVRELLKIIHTNIEREPGWMYERYERMGWSQKGT